MQDNTAPRQSHRLRIPRSRHKYALDHIACSYNWVPLISETAGLPRMAKGTETRRSLLSESELVVRRVAWECSRCVPVDLWLVLVCIDL